MAKPYENLKKLREQKKISVRKMASLLNTSPSQLFYLETGKVALSFDWIERFTQILECTPADIIGYENLGIKPIEKLHIPPDSLASKIKSASGDINPKLIELQKIILNKEQEPIEVKVFTQEFSCGPGAQPLNYEDYTPTIFLRGILKELSPNVNSIIGIRASGDSMSPIINHKDLVFVDTSKLSFTPHKNPLKSIYAFRHDNMLCIKILVNDSSNPLILTAHSFNNNKHSSFTIDLKNNPDFSIIGKVVGFFGKV